MSKSKIEWTDYTWNPVVGCRKVSPACDSCYAERMAFRLACMGQGKYMPVSHWVDDGKPHDWTGDVFLDESALTEPLHWRKPRTIFVVSMGDLFYERVPFEFIDKVFAVMALCPQHTFLLLTKRSERAREYISYKNRASLVDWPMVNLWREQHGCASPCEWKRDIRALPLTPDRWPLPNVWLGCTAENQEQADKRIPILLATPAAKRFVSVEPMLSAIDLSRWIGYYPVHENESESRERRSGSATRWGTCLGFQGKILEDRQEGVGPLEEEDRFQAMQASEGGTPNTTGIPSTQSNEEQGSRLCGCPQGRLPSAGRTHPKGNDDQSQERDQRRQSTGESGGDDVLGKPAPCEPRSRYGCGSKPVGGEQPSSQVDGLSGCTHQAAVHRDSSGTESQAQSPDRQAGHEVRRTLHNGVEHSKESPTELSWCIVGCESGPWRRPTQIDHIRDLRDQCVAAGVPFLLKQMMVDGKLVKMPALDGRVWNQRSEAKR